jgi:hypothetical protein
MHHGNINFAQRQMHDIEPYFKWRDLYIAEEDELSPFFEREYNEFSFDKHVYNYLLHPQWDDIGSETLFIKILYVDYERGYCIIEGIGEWNDAINNDIMFLKREVLEPIMSEGINKFIFLGENVLNFHGGGDDYYAELAEELDNGFVAFVNFQDHVKREFIAEHIQHYITFFDDIDWRNRRPIQVLKEVEEKII